MHMYTRRTSSANLQLRSSAMRDYTVLAFVGSMGNVGWYLNESLVKYPFVFMLHSHRTPFGSA